MIPAFVLRSVIVASQSFHRLCCYGPFLLVIFSSACTSSSSKGANNQQDTSLHIIQLPEPAQLAAAERQRIAAACQEFYDTMLKPKGFNGGIIVAKGGNIVFEKYTGTGHIPGRDSITANTPFHVASVSKTFTAMAILKLAEEGKIKLDEELSKYFPKFNYPGITIRTLLSHRSGLPNYAYFMEDLGWDKNTWMTNLDMFSWMTLNKSLIQNIGVPNTRFTYCNTNYALLALLVQVASGKEFAQYLKETFFDPLQMKNTFVFTTADSSRVIPSYDWKGRLMPFNFLDAVYGDKNVYTTCRDLLTWDRALKSGKLFKAETLQEAYTPYSNEKPGVRNYGLGWHLNIYPTGKKIIYHNGWWHGNNAVFIRLLDEDASIILTGNRFTSAIYKARKLANIFGNYDIPDEEEENGKSTDSVLTQPLQAPLPASPFIKKTVSKKDSLLQDLLRDKHREAEIKRGKKLG